MSIKRFTANKDNTISSAFKLNLSSRSKEANMGSSDILEMFAIYGQSSSSSLEQSRILVEFPLSAISSRRDAAEIPASGSVVFKLKMFNAEHNQTTPEKVTVSTRILTREWSEGSGLDMESYLDEGASNWTSASKGVVWYNEGGDYLSSSYMNNSAIPLQYNQYLELGVENLDIDVTQIIEEYIKNINGQSTAATGSVIFNTIYPPAIGDALKIYTYEGDYRTFQFSNTTGSTGKVVLVETHAHANTSSANLINAINTHLGDYIAATGQGEDLTASLSQRVATLYGNTNISSSMSSVTASINQFSGGTGAINYGFLLKLSGSLEDGSLVRSYYTKKFFARSSHHQLERPFIEAQWDSSIKDDRGSIIKSSSLAPSTDNLNNIFLYNRQRGGLVDIPTTGSNVVVSLVNPTGSSHVSLTGPSVTEPNTYITASRHSRGVYKAQFAYSGTESELRDIWHYTGSETGGHIGIFTGSTFTVGNQSAETHYNIPSYLTNVTNLKSSYSSEEQARFRVYTRNKSWSPNIYTVATNTAPVDTVRDAYYKISRVSDDMTVIPYSTGSTPSYSSVSYDISGSFFDLDMSILEPNYLYEISFLYKDGIDYIEQKEKFKFRVDA